jgi:hypothetical protein
LNIEVSDWAGVLAKLREQAAADGVIRYDPDDLFNLSADAGLDMVAAPENWARTVKDYRTLMGLDRPEKPKATKRRKAK